MRIECESCCRVDQVNPYILQQNKKSEREAESKTAASFNCLLRTLLSSCRSMNDEVSCFGTNQLIQWNCTFLNMSFGWSITSSTACLFVCKAKFNCNAGATVERFVERRPFQIPDRMERS